MGDYMYKYHLFIISNNSYKIYKNNPKNLYDILNIICHMKSTDLIYGLNLYNSLCDTFSVKLLKDYIIDRFDIKQNSKFIFLNNKCEKTNININYSNTYIISNIKYPEIFRIFNIYNKRIFVIDIEHEKYFWLNNLKLTNKL